MLEMNDRKKSCVGCEWQVDTPVKTDVVLESSGSSGELKVSETSCSPSD